MNLPSLCKKTLLLLVVSRREAAIAFIQTSSSLISSSSPSSPVITGSQQQQQQYNPLASTTPRTPNAVLQESAGHDVDLATAPLGKLIRLGENAKECAPTTGKNNKTDTGNKENSDPSKRNVHRSFQLVSPTEDEIPLQEGQRLVCIGDVHGDFRALEEFLTIAGVYDKDATVECDQWIGGNTIVVQCGDVLDRGSQELQCFDLLTKLSQQAAAQDGCVILLWGNHESLNAGGMFHYTTGEYEYEANLGKLIDEQLKSPAWRIQYAGNQPARWAAYEPGSGVLAHPLLANMKVAVKVGKTVCVHAGLTAKHLDQYGGLKGMNGQAQNWMKHTYMKNNNFAKYDSKADLVADINKRAQHGANSMPEVLGGGSGSNSPVWMRDYSDPNDKPPKNPKAQQMIDATLFHLRADRMVMGHTVQREINVALNGKAWRIDVGASRGVMGGTPEVLEVVMKDGKEVVSILNDKKGKIPAKERQINVSVASAVSSMLSG